MNRGALVFRGAGAAFAAAAVGWSADVTLSAMLTAPRVEPGVVIPGTDLEATGSPLLGLALAMRGAGVLVRGPAQADLSLYGGTFQQTQLLLDGVRLFDPQTAHHLLNLPVAPEEVARVEIAAGSAASPLGPGAYSGAVNIVTAPAGADRAHIRLSAGSFGTTAARVSIPAGGARLSLGSYHTDGFREGADTHLSDVLVRTEGFTVGYTDRVFGARDYYTTSPGEYERTRTAFAVARRTVSLGPESVLDIRAGGRVGEDFYTTNRSDPWTYANEHTSGSGEAAVAFVRGAGDVDGWEIGCSAASWALDSRGYSTVAPSYRGMGRFTDHSAAVFGRVGHRWNVGLAVSGALRSDWYSRYDVQWSPSAMVSWTPLQDLRVRLSGGSVHRIPSYTELYYWDPAHETDAALKVERTRAYDAAAEWRTGPLWWRLAGYRYENTNAIDWVRAVPAAGPWRVTNLARVDVSVGEVHLEWPRRAWLSVRSTHRDIGLPEGVETKYIGRYHPVSASCGVIVPVLQRAHVALLHRYGGEVSRGFLAGTFSVQYRTGPVAVQAAIDNLYDVPMEDVPGVPLPGRSFNGGVSFAW